jgi:hypothetical protein
MLKITGLSSGLLRRVVVFQRCLLALMMEVASTLETSVNFYQTKKGSYLETRRHENLKYHVTDVDFILLSPLFLVSAELRI